MNIVLNIEDKNYQTILDFIRLLPDNQCRISNPSEELNKIIDTFIQTFIAELKKEAPYFYDDYPNLFIDLGCDICSGDGELSNVVSDRLRYKIKQLPAGVKAWLWITSIGQHTNEYIRECIESGFGDYSDIGLDDDDMNDDLLDLFITPVFSLAEDAYTDHQIAECESEDEDDEDFIENEAK